MPTNHVFVDFENIQKIDLPVIGSKDVNFTLLIGPEQKRLNSDLVERLLESSATVRLVRLTSSGKNALDFALSYYAGQASAIDPQGHIHIVSKDQGFDPLVEHLATKGTNVIRHESFATLSFLPGPLQAATPIVAVKDDVLAKAAAYLKKNSKNRPKRRKTLLGHLKNHFSKELSAKGLKALIIKLESNGHVMIDPKDNVSYPGS